MSRTFHHRAQKHIRRVYEVWSKRCPNVSMWNYSAFMKRVSSRWERRAGKRELNEQFTESKSDA